MRHGSCSGSGKAGTVSGRRDSAWIDRVAHDLRGPLAPMQTAVYLLREPGVDAGQHGELLGVLERQIARLSGMISEFSDFGRAETGQLLARRESVEIASLVGDVATSLKPCLPDIRLAEEVTGFEVEGDVLRLSQLFRTLLGLQLARGEATPVSAHLDTGGTGLRMRCAVRCAGPSDDLAALLLAGPHPDPPDDTLGFGLIIARAIATAHGGSLRGRAAGPDTLAFVLELPRAGAAPCTARAPG